MMAMVVYYIVMTVMVIIVYHIIRRKGLLFFAQESLLLLYDRWSSHPDTPALHSIVVPVLHKHDKGQVKTMRGVKKTPCNMKMMMILTRL